MDRRRGIFTIDRRIMTETPLAEMSQIMAGVVVWRTEHKFEFDHIEFFAECEEFAPVPEGSIPPDYELQIVCEDGEFVRREFHPT